MQKTEDVLVKILSVEPQSASDINDAVRRVLHRAMSLASTRSINLSVTEAAYLQSDLATIRTVRPDWFERGVDNRTGNGGSMTADSTGRLDDIADADPFFRRHRP